MNEMAGGERTAAGEATVCPVTRRICACPAAIGVFVLAVAVRVPFLFSPGFPADQTQFIEWSEKARTAGLAEVYEKRPDGKRFCNYPPGYVFVLWWLGAAYDRLAPAGVTLDDTVAWAVWSHQDSPAARLAVWFYKTPAVFADALLGALLVTWLTGRIGRWKAAAVGAIYVLMPAAIHDSAVWGQTDAIHTLLMVASLEMARRRNIRLMAILATFALLTKAQALVLLPVWAMVTLDWCGGDVRRWLTTVAVVALVIVVVLAPFSACLDGVWEAYAGAAGYYPFTHLNGFSAWFLRNPLDRPHLEGRLDRFYAPDDAKGWLDVTPRTLGLGTVLAVWGVVLLVLRQRRGDERALFWAARLLPVAFFVLSTQMHERYLFPAIAIWAWAYRARWRWWACWLVLGAAASVNQLWAWAGPQSASWARVIGEALHQQWVGMTCAAAIAAVFVVVLVGGLDGRDIIGKKTPAAQGV